MTAIDYAVVVAYLAGCSILGARIGAAGRSGAAGGGVRGYFVGERDIPGWAVMISIVATETSAVTFLSVPGIATKGDMTFLQLAFGYILARVVVAAVLMPAYFRGEIQTAYEVLDRRFGGATRRAASVLFLVSRTLASGLRLFLAAVVLRTITGWDLTASIAIIGGVTLAYTYLGGIKAVVWIDVVQFAIYLIAAAVAMAIILDQVPGGAGAIWRRGLEAGKFRVIRSGCEGMAWPGSIAAAASAIGAMLAQPYTIFAGLIGGLVLDTGTHGADQMMVQRYLTARSGRAAGRALVASGFVIVAQFALFLAIGVGLWALYQDRPPDRTLVRGDEYFAYFIAHYLPAGLLGLVVAAIVSVTMSTVSGALSASASSTINDLIRPARPDLTERSLLRISKGATAFWAVVEVGVAIGAERLDGSVVDNALAIASFVTGLLLGLFLLGLWTREVGQRSAFLGLLAGTAAVTATKFLTTAAYPWYAPVGSGTVVLVGWLAEMCFPAPRQGNSAVGSDLE